MGAGKTTLIKQFFEFKDSQEEWAIIVNEFGKIPIDSNILHSATSSKGAIYEIAGGCICCSARENFAHNLEQILQTGQYDRILIEPSGLGGVEMTSGIVGEYLQLKLMPVCCLVDLTSILNPRLKINPIYNLQIRQSDQIVLSKLDLLDEQQKTDLLSRFRQKYPEVKIYQSRDRTPLFSSILSLSELQDSMVSGPFKQLLYPGNSEKAAGYIQKTVRLEPGEQINWNQFFSLLHKEKTVVRAKGFVKSDGGWMLFQYTISGETVESCQAQSQSEMVIIFEKADESTVDLFLDKIVALTSR